MTEAKQSYAARQREARAAASAKRKAEREAWLRQVTLIAETRRLALQLAKDEIRASGRKVSNYTIAQLRSRAEAMIGPWLVAKARARIEAWDCSDNNQSLNSVAAAEA
jgi:hypothetical protein